MKKKKEKERIIIKVWRNVTKVKDRIYVRLKYCKKEKLISEEREEFDNKKLPGLSTGNLPENYLLSCESELVFILKKENNNYISTRSLI